jgi:hypothetical protein
MLFANVHIPSMDAAGILASNARISLLGRDAALVGNYWARRYRVGTTFHGIATPRSKYAIALDRSIILFDVENQDQAELALREAA